MDRSTCQQNRDLEAQRRAAAILAKSRQELPELPRPQEPAMKRYSHPIPCWGSCPWPSSPPEHGQNMDRVLEELTRQNQLLVELLGAVNALTAAILSIRSRFVGEE